MLAIRSIPRVSAIVAAAAAGACLVLSGCGGGSIGGTPAASGSSASSGGSSGGGSSASPAGTSTASLTGHFCTDLTKIGRSVPRVPAAQLRNLAANRPAAAAILNSFVAEFNGLATEAPPAVASDLRTIAAAYQSEAGAVLSGSATEAQLKQSARALATSGATGTAFRGLLEYLVLNCH